MSGADRVLMSGNEAMAEGAIRAGLKFYAGYPITPQNELIGYMAEHLIERGGVFLQSESELAAINMVFGASAAGARAMTSSSSPGISLKQEGLSYLSAAELPAVVVNVMRAGPGLANVWPAQSDYFQATKGGGHGDYHMIVLAPGSVQESFDLMRTAFDLADTYRVVAMVLSDGILGQMMEGLEMPRTMAFSTPVPKPWALTGAQGRIPNIVRSLYMERGEIEKLNERLQKKYRRIKAREQRVVLDRTEDARVAVVAYGSMARIAAEAINALRAKGHRVGLIRLVTLWPFPEKTIAQLTKKVRRLLVVEMSAGQMVDDVRLCADKKTDVRFYGRMGGGVPTQKQIEREILKMIR